LDICPSVPSPLTNTSYISASALYEIFKKFRFEKI
jgi:hypothetical protein